MKRRCLSVFVLPAMLLLCVSALAHHGAAAYEAKLTTLQGTITQFQFLNPHAEIFFEVTDASGKTQKWIAEAVSASSMSRGGWTKNTLKPGDMVTITGNCAKNGALAMRLAKVVLPSGKVLNITRGEDYIQ